MKRDTEIMNMERASRGLLARQYSIIGSELLSYESSASTLVSVLEFAIQSRWSEQEASRQERFQHGVSFIQLAVLESYAEDLVDLECKDDELYIRSKYASIGKMLFVWLGMVFALTSGSLAAFSGGTFLFSLLITTLVALPFGMYWHVSPCSGVARRMNFAKILFREISRRRGGDGDFIPPTPVFSVDRHSQHLFGGEGRERGLPGCC